MSDLAISREDVERVQRIAYAKKDEWEGDEAAEQAAGTLIEFCDVLLGRDTVDNFLRSQDMED